MCMINDRLLLKKDIMDIYNCKSDKALRILKYIFESGYGNKIGKQYSVLESQYIEFLKFYKGENVII